MNKTMYINTKKQIPVVVHNYREEQLVDIINTDINRTVEWYNENTFGDNTLSICTRAIDEDSVRVSALYFMDCIEYEEYRRFNLWECI